jgi:CRISPR/Cas system-associated exonuclease Cas4 (RecB family)
MITSEEIDAARYGNQPIVFHHSFRPSSWSSCDRAIWLNVRNASFVTHKATTLRTFEIGHRLEDMLIKEVIAAEYKVSHQQGVIKNKWGAEFGHIDGIITKGKEHALLEIKTANDARWKDWVKKGIPESYYAQAQIYMHHSDQLSKKGNKLQKCVFVVLNKNTSEVLIDTLEYSQAYAESQMERIYNILESESLPEGVNDFRCNFCNHRLLCKGEKVAEVSCRTCAHVDVKDDQYTCQHGTDLCEKHIMHPELMNLAGVPVVSIDHATQTIDYGRFTQGGEIDGKPRLTSQQFKRAKETGLLTDDFVIELLSQFDAMIDEVRPV